MKKIISVFILMFMVTVVFVGCGGDPLRSYDDFIAEMESSVFGSADFTTIHLGEFFIDEETVCNVYQVEDAEFGGRYTIHIYTNTASEIIMAELHGDRSATTYNSTQFAALSLSVYNAMGFSKLDADKLNSRYDLLSDGNIKESQTVKAYEVTARTGESTSSIEFTILLSDK